MDSDELTYYEPGEGELALMYISLMLDSLLEQLLWLKVVVDEELERIEKESGALG